MTLTYDHAQIRAWMIAAEDQEGRQELLRRTAVSAGECNDGNLQAAGKEEGEVIRTAAAAIACTAFSACSATSWRATAPHNTPKDWEYNARLEGWRSLYAGYKQLSAPRGFIWDDLTGSYQQDLSDGRGN